MHKEKQQDSLAATSECYCPQLFQLEQYLLTLTLEAQYNKRLELKKPILDTLSSWAIKASAKTAPKSALEKALHYLREQWPYLENGKLELSNNCAKKENNLDPYHFLHKTPGLSQAD